MKKTHSTKEIVLNTAVQPQVVILTNFLTNAVFFLRLESNLEK